MSTSVGTKAAKKQSPLSKKTLPAADRRFEASLLALEDACLLILENRAAPQREDTEGRYWQHRLMNVASPVSLALMEYKGPRHFHYHYRHREDDRSVLRPVLENPVDTLAQTCKAALKACRAKLAGLMDEEMARARRTLENALQNFLIRYKEYREKYNEE